MQRVGDVTATNCFALAFCVLKLAWSLPGAQAWPGDDARVSLPLTLSC
jgi:hypothetical protein